MWVEEPRVSVGGEVCFVLALLPSEKKSSDDADDYKGDTTEDATYNGPCVQATIEDVRMILL